MQVAVEVRVEPKPRAHGPIVFGHRNGPAPKDEPRAPVFDRRFEQWVSGEPTPCFQFKAKAFVVTDNRNQVAWVALSQHSDQLRQQTGREGLSPDIQIHIGSHRNEFYSSEST
jgi:hypothetical protein